MSSNDRATTRRRRDELVRRARRAGDVADVFAAASTRLRRIVPFDAAVWVTTDPVTGLPTGPTRVEDLAGVTAAQCSENWRQEFIEGDVNQFRELIRAELPAGALRAAAGDPRRSQRYRKLLHPLGYDDELRAVLRTGETPWGAVSLFRREGQPPFSTSETQLVAGLSAPLGEALRSRAHARRAVENSPGQEPGLMVFDTTGELISANEQTKVWLAELPADQVLPTGHGIDVPMWLLITVFQAAAAMSDRGDGTARARIRSRRGQWLVCNATCLSDRAGPLGQVAVVIEPAQASEIAPIIIDTYDLTDREQQITRLIARGATSADIANELFLSVHTVRDHVKNIFQKVDVTSRGELVAKLFAEHFEPGYRRSAVHVDTGAA
jgi:DNA-binding CsgD family transcriptional regulator